MVERVGKDGNLHAVALVHGSEKSDAKDEARARLAAQAPRMARLLIDHAGDCSHGGTGMRAGCPVCESIASILRDAGVLE